MSYSENGFNTQNTVYASAETRPENPPSLVGGTILMTSENDDVLYALEDFVKSYPATNTYAISIVDAEENELKNLANGLSGAPSNANLDVTFDYENDYAAAVNTYLGGGILTALPEITSFDAYLMSTDEVSGKTRKVAVRIASTSDCYTYPVETQDRTTSNQSEPANTYPITVNVSEFFASDGGYTWEASASGEGGWGETVDISTQPLDGEWVSVYIRLAGDPTCPPETTTYTGRFIRQDPT